MSQSSAIQGSPLLHTLLTQATGVSSNKTARAGAGQTPATPATQDSAAVSSTAAALLKAGADGDVRMDKVAALQTAIANGTYSVSSGRVADKLLQSLLR